jgi:aryl-alcohol dehydrogenase-like predicted oxidoreductase
MRPGPYEHLQTDAVFDLLEDLERQAQERGTTMAALALAWLLANPAVTAVIVGPRTPAQLEPALAALQIEQP